MRYRRKSPGKHERLLAVSSSLAAVLLAGAGLLVLAGCEEDDCVNCVPTPPPPAPTGVRSITGDEGVTVCWDHVQVDERAPRVVEYLVWRDLTPWDEDEVFDFAGRVPVEGAAQLSYCFFDDGLANGTDYSYAVSAVDSRGAESGLSRELVIDTPRPEGYGLELFAGMGFDFSALGPVGRSEPAGAAADIEVRFVEGVPFAAVHRSAVFIQDYGTFVDADGYVRLDWVDWAPLSGYSSTGVVELIEGHAYILEIAEPLSGEVHYAKFAVLDVRATSVLIDWAYQIAPEWPELIAPAGPRIEGRTAAAREHEPIRF